MSRLASVLPLAFVGVSAVVLSTSCSGRAVPSEDASGEPDSGKLETAPPTSEAEAVTGTNPPTSEAGEEGESDTSDNTSAPFVNEDAPDDDACGHNCSTWTQEGCEEGEKCTAIWCELDGMWDRQVCRAIEGDGQLGDECSYTQGSAVSGYDTCALGMTCWHPEVDTEFGYCAAYCMGSPEQPQCPAGSSCLQPGSTNLALCVPGCDPLAQDCVKAADSCQPNTDDPGYLCALEISSDMSPYGTVCQWNQQCNPGTLCLDPGAVPEPGCDADKCCSPMCSISAGEPCPGTGQTCEPVFDPQPAGYEDVGVCRTV